MRRSDALLEQRLERAIDEVYRGLKRLADVAVEHTRQEVETVFANVLANTVFAEKLAKIEELFDSLEDKFPREENNNVNE